MTPGNTDDTSSSNTILHTTHAYNKTKSILIFLTENPTLEIEAVLKILEVPNPGRISSILKKSNVKDFEALNSLTRLDWDTIPIQSDQKQSLTSKLAFLNHSNRFEQQSKNFFSFVFIPSYFLIFTITFILLSVLFWVVSPSGVEGSYQQEISFDSKDKIGTVKTVKVKHKDFPIYVYIVHEDLYQNHRMFNGNVSFAQLSGDVKDTYNCNGFATFEKGDEKEVIYPAGRAAYTYNYPKLSFSLKDNDGVLKEQPDAMDNVLLPQDVTRFVEVGDGPKYKFDGREIEPPKVSDSEFINWMKFSVLKNSKKLFAILKLEKGNNVNEIKIKLEKNERKMNYKFELVSGKNKDINEGLIYLHFVVIVFGVLFGLGVPLIDFIIYKKKNETTV